MQSLKDILPATIQTSPFTRGSYEFWEKTYARDLNFKDAPAAWRIFLLTETNNEIAELSYALETAYSIISRLILAKAADDSHFPGVNFVGRMQASFDELSIHGRVKPEDYMNVIRRSFERAGQILFHSIFSQDIFDWWYECKSAELFLALGEAMLVMTQFDFSQLSGDLLGEMYQHYFDRETRKALGEFYTPAEVIEFILDECGYTGQRDLRLLDPACGSGSFLVAALKRYLKRQSGANRASALRDLTEGLRIVGFDINPFAVLMAQVNYAALLLPWYADVIRRDPDFRIVRLPIFRTDSLRLEEREEEGGTSSREKLQVSLHFEEKVLNISIYLPIREGQKRFVKQYVAVPRFKEARQEGLVVNLQEYISALAMLFQAARDPHDPHNSLEALLAPRFADRTRRLLEYLTPTFASVIAAQETLKSKYSDGRFLKTIEDLVLSVSLKHDLQYDFVVANPPYVRVQKIPEHVKEYWPGNYEWTTQSYDLYVPFLERCVRSPNGSGWLNNNGRLGFILSNRFLNVDYGTKLREELPKYVQIKLLIDFRDTRVFAGALNYPAILIAECCNAGAAGTCTTARVFASEAEFRSLKEEFSRLRMGRSTTTARIGNGVEVFEFPKDRLLGPGWWLMPHKERLVFDKLRRIRGRRLSELAATQSAAFQGYSTSADKALVFDEIEDKGTLVLVRPRHEDKNCGCGTDGVELERGILRPFLFGKDVGRWAIEWKRAFLLFPYDKYQKKRGLFDDVEIVEDWNLIPSKDNIGEFSFAEPDSVETFEERFPRAWKYLKKHEGTLRKRENSRFAKGHNEEGLWYGATYPRGLDYYFQPKIVLQVLSRNPSFALDSEGRFVFTAGGTAGVYGIVLKDRSEEHLLSVLAVLNSRCADFSIKQISSVFGGRFYSYGDQFIADLRLPIQRRAFGALAAISEALLGFSKEQSALARKIAAFPESFVRDLARFEMDSVSHLCAGHPSAAQVVVEPSEIAVQRRLYSFAVTYGSQRVFEFEHQEHAECLAEAFRNIGRRGLATKEILNWYLPVGPTGCNELLSLLRATRECLRGIQARIAAQEERLNESVYRLYGIDESERGIIEGFLTRYSSVSIVAGLAEDSENRDE